MPRPRAGDLQSQELSYLRPRVGFEAIWSMHFAIDAQRDAAARQIKRLANVIGVVYINPHTASFLQSPL
jgi:hypothetical protein